MLTISAKAILDVELEGSDEDMRSDINQLLAARTQAGGGPSYVYCRVVAMFTKDKYCIYECNDYSGSNSTCTHYMQKFTIGKDQEPVLSGDPTQVRVTFVAGEQDPAAGEPGTKEATSWFDVSAGSSSKSFADKMKGLVSSVLGAATGERPALQLTKDADGRMRFVCYPTNNYVDREDELFTAESHTKAIDWYFRNKSFPELWVWHTKGTKFGQVDWMDFVKEDGSGNSAGGVVVASGTIDPGFEELASTLATKDNAMSHGFLGVRERTGSPRAWTDYRDYELSVLPAKAVANYGTAFNLMKGAKDKMAFSADKRAYLKDTLKVSDERIALMEKDTEGIAKGLASLGIESKSFGLVDPDPEPDPNPAPPPTEVAAIIEQHNKDLGVVVAKAKELITAAEARAVVAEKSLADAIARYAPRDLGAAAAQGLAASTKETTAVADTDPEVRAAIEAGKKAMDSPSVGGAISAMLNGAGMGRFNQTPTPTVIGPVIGATPPITAPAVQVPVASGDAVKAMAGFGS